jgi:hypothetical protein
MHAFLLVAALFASAVPTSVPARTPVKFKGATAKVAGSRVTETGQLYTVRTGTGELLTVPQPGSTLRGRVLSVEGGI